MLNSIPRYIAVIALIAIIVTVIWVAVYLLLFKQYPDPRFGDPQQPFTAQHFNYGSIGNETNRGIPYWIWRVLPTMFPEYLPEPSKGWSSLGVYWEAGEELPVGFSKRSIGVIPRVSFNCAFCHQGSYRLMGEERSRLLIAGTGNQVAAQEFLNFLMAVAQDPRFNASTVLAEIKKIYDMPWWEKLLYRAIVPATRRALQEQVEINAWMHDKPAWGRGRIAPFNPVKYGILEQPYDDTVGNSDMMPLWNMQIKASTSKHPADRPAVYTNGQYRYLHWDGLSSDLYEIVLAGALGDGTDKDTFTALFHLVDDHLENITAYVDKLAAPQSPYTTECSEQEHILAKQGQAGLCNPAYLLNAQQVERGQQLFYTNYAGDNGKTWSCAECHAETGKRYRTVIGLTEVGTDPSRALMWTEAAKQAYLNYDKPKYDWEFKHFHNIEGYIAVDLEGIWARAPYLHNGSVPTLSDLLKPEDQRPTEFYRGYDVLEPHEGGFISQGDAARRVGSLYQVNKKVLGQLKPIKGNGNQGHLWGVTWSQEDKDALLAYLKTL